MGKTTTLFKIDFFNMETCVVETKYGLRTHGGASALDSHSCRHFLENIKV